MGAPKGNQNKKGKKHPGRGGRGTIRDEKSNYDELEKIWNEELSEEEVKKMLEGKRSFKAIFKSKGLLGNEKFVLALFDKLFPNKTDWTSQGGRIGSFVLSDEDEQRVLNLFRNYGKSRSKKTGTTKKVAEGQEKSDNQK